MESASLLSSEEQTRAEIGQECCDGAGAGCCAVDDAGASSVTDTKEGAGERANEAVGTAAASGVSSSCQSGACNTACRARAAHHRKKLAELREQRKWHRGDFNNLYNSTLKDHRHADAGADVEPGHADAGAVIPAIVWSCLPGITMFAPIIGHVGVLRSDGALLDFAMSYAINLDRPAFGKPIRLLSLEPYMRIGGGGGGGDCVSHGSFEFERKGDQGDGEAERYVCSWDKILSEAVREYQNEQYSFFSNNCHTFVAHCLNKAKIPGPMGLPWNMITICGVMITSRFVSMTHLATRVAYTSGAAIVGYLIFGTAFFFWWAVTLAALTAYFSLYVYYYQWRP